MHINDVCHLLAPQLLEECGNAFRWGLATWCATFVCQHCQPCPVLMPVVVYTGCLL